jgi:Protein of unknown function (DUF3096)
LFRKNGRLKRGIFGQFLRTLEPVEETGVSYSGTAPAVKLRPSIRPNNSAGDISMTIGSAHIPAIVALLAGVLILIAPRFLNFIVAIYLIIVGLAGLGVFKMLRF